MSQLVFCIIGLGNDAFVVSFLCRNCNQESVELSVKSRAATLCWLQSLFPARTSCWTPARGWRRGWRRPPRPPPGPGSWPRGWSAATRRRTRRRSSWRRTQRTSLSSASLRQESPPRCKQTDSWGAPRNLRCISKKPIFRHILTSFPLSITDYEILLQSPADRQAKWKLNNKHWLKLQAYQVIKCCSSNTSIIKLYYWQENKGTYFSCCILPPTCHFLLNKIYRACK